MWLKLFRKRKMQTFLIGLIILFCTSLICGAFCILTSLQAPYEKFGDECQSPDARFFPIAKDREMLRQEEQKFENLNMVKKVLYLDVYSHVESVEANGKKINSFLCVAKYNKEVFQHVKMGEGKRLDMEKLGENECFIPICTALDNKIKVGDTIKMGFGSFSKEYKVKGTYADPYNLSTAFDTYLITGEIPASIRQNASMHCFITVKDGEDPEELSNEYRRANDGKMSGVIETLREHNEDIQLTNDILGAIFLAIGIIILLSGCMIISFMIRNTMIADAKKVAIMKTVGYSSGDIIRMYLGFYFVVSFLSSALGVVVSMFLSKFVLKSAFDAMGKTPEIVILVPGIICVVGVVGFVLLIIGAILLKTRKVKPVSILSDQSEITTKKRKKRSQVKVLFSPAGIAIRTIVRNPKGTIGILVTSIITIFIINFGMISLNVANRVSQTNDFWFGIDNCQVSVGIQDDDKNYPKIMGQLQQDSRVEKLVPVSFDQKIQTTWQNNKGGNFLGCFVYEDYNQVNLPMVEGKNPSNKDEIAVTAKVAEKLGKKIGDYLTLDFPDGTKASYLICGTFQTYYQLGDAARMRKDGLTSRGQKVIMTNISVYLKNGTDRAKFIQDTRNKAGGGFTICNREEVFQSIMDMIAAPQQKGIPGVVAIVLFVGGVSIFSIVLLQASKNHRNSCIYKCIGYSTTHLVCANLIHTLLISVVATCIAVPVCIGVYPSIMRLSLMMFGLKVYPIQYTLKYSLIANGSVIVIFILATLLSSRRLKKVDVRELIQE